MPLLDDAEHAIVPAAMQFVSILGQLQRSKRSPPGKSSQALKPEHWNHLPKKIYRISINLHLPLLEMGASQGFFPPIKCCFLSWCCLWTSPSPLTKKSGWLTVGMKRILHFCQNRSQLIQKGVQVTVLPIFPGQRNLMEVVEKKTVICWWKINILVGAFNPSENISPNGNLPQIGVKVKKCWNHHLVYFWPLESGMASNGPLFRITTTTWHVRLIQHWYCW